ncbi:MAG: hypothetical protein M1358_23765 [Chloroflexi bacterium]|nr:hypothetical protein [Chloroflexota bacterium]
MTRRIDPSLARPDADGGDIHTTAVFLLAFLLFGVVSAILLTGLDVKLPDLATSQNRIVANLFGGTKAPPKLSEPPAPARAPVEAVAEQEAPQPEPTQAPARKTVKVVNTGGVGVYVRRTPNMADRLVAWPDNAIMEIVGEDRTVGELRWRNVKDPAGNVGWIPAEYLSE